MFMLKFFSGVVNKQVGSRRDWRVLIFFLITPKYMFRFKSTYWYLLSIWWPALCVHFSLLFVSFFNSFCIGWIFLVILHEHRGKVVSGARGTCNSEITFTTGPRLHILTCQLMYWLFDAFKCILYIQHSNCSQTGSLIIGSKLLSDLSLRLSFLASLPKPELGIDLLWPASFIL